MITARDECEEEAQELGLVIEKSYSGSWDHYPSYCSYRESQGKLYFNRYQDGNNNTCTDTVKCLCRNGLLPRKIQQEKKC